VIFSSLFTFYPAFANAFKIGLLSFFDLVNDKVVLQIKGNMCDNYLSSFNDTSQWPSESLRTEVAIKSCKDIELAKLQKLDKSEISPNLSSNYNLSTASSTISQNNFLNSIIVENINKIYPKTVSNEPIVSVESSSTKTDTNIEVVTNTGISNSDIIILTNNERQKAGIKTLKENSLLDKIAKERLEDMFNQGYFEHVSPQGISVSDIAKTDGYSYILIGENIALGNFSSSKELVAAWMESTGHKENILNPSFSEIGVYAKAGSYNGAEMIIGVQVFGKSTTSCTYPDANLKAKIEAEISQVNDFVATGKIYLQDIQAMEPVSSANSVVYNSKVSEYNVLVKEIDALYTDIKQITDTYNTQIKAYNSCISLIN
jgi:uncharacterized protein YkwD